MADFIKAYHRTAQWEGGWSDDPLDRGGSTYAGIARKFHPDWDGWPLIDQVKNKQRGQIIVNPVLQVRIKDFYRSEFWNRMSGDKILSQRVAEFIYDWFVNSGAAGLKEVQNVVNATPDGIIGPRTLSAINREDEDELMGRLICSRLAFVSSIVASNPTQAKFLKGWNNRIKAFQS